jgi:hypothetical protein
VNRAVAAAFVVVLTFASCGASRAVKPIPGVVQLYGGGSQLDSAERRCVDRDPGLATMVRTARTGGELNTLAFGARASRVLECLLASRRDTRRR